MKHLVKYNKKNIFLMLQIFIFNIKISQVVIEKKTSLECKKKRGEIVKYFFNFPKVQKRKEIFFYII